MAFDYGAAAPPEPTPAQIFDALAGGDDDATQPVLAGTAAAPARAPQAPQAPAPSPRSPSTTAGVLVEGLDTGRFDVGDVAIDDVPGLIDSRLFAIMTPDHVDVSPIQGLEHTTQGDASAITTHAAEMPGLERRNDEVGDVSVEVVPGLFGSDLFRANVDVAAGAAASAAVLEVSPNAASRGTKKGDGERRRIVCATCSSVHWLLRCPSCGTAVLDRDGT